MTRKVNLSPLDVRGVGDKELMITWSDGHRSIYSYRFLRFNCPCAQCVDERTGERVIKEESIMDKIKSLSADQVGLYAFKFRWNDGHQTGIYSYDMLRKICSCPLCSPDIA